MLKVAVHQKNDLRRGLGPAVAHGRLVAKGIPTRYVVACPALADDPLRGGAICRETARRLVDSIKAMSSPKGLAFPPQGLHGLLRQTIEEARNTILVRSMSREAELVIAVARGNEIHVACTTNITASVGRESVSRSVPARRIDSPPIDSEPRVSGNIVSVRTQPGERFLAVAPGFPHRSGNGNNENLSRALHDVCGGGLRLSAVGRVLSRLLASARPADRLIVGFQTQQGIPADVQGPPRGEVPPELTPAPTGPTGKAVAADRNAAVEALSRQLDGLQRAVEATAKQRTPDEDRSALLLRQLQDREQRDIDEHIVQPMIRQIMLLYDRLDRRPNGESNDAMAAAKVDVREFLSTYGVEPYQTPGHRFDRDTQRCVGAKNAAGPSADGMIAVRVRDGFRRKNTTIRYEEVIVWRHESQNLQYEEI